MEPKISDYLKLDEDVIRRSPQQHSSVPSDLYEYVDSMGIFHSVSQSTQLTANPAYMYHQHRGGINPLYQQSVAGAAKYRQQYTEIGEKHSGVRSTNKLFYGLALLSILSILGLVLCIAVTVAMSIKVVQLQELQQNLSSLMTNITANTDYISQLRNQV